MFVILLCYVVVLSYKKKAGLPLKEPWLFITQFLIACQKNS